MTLPVNPAFASLNLAQAVLIVGYEWCKLQSGGALPFAMPQKSAPATREQLLAFFDNLERELEQVEYFRPADKRDTMLINLRNIFHRMGPTRQDIQTLQGVIMAIAEGRKGPARGGVLDGAAGGGAAHAARRARRRPRAHRPRAGARPGAAAAAQSDRSRARAVGRAHQGPPLRRPRLQAADADRAPHGRSGLVSAACRGRPRAGGGGRGGRQGACGSARMALGARLSAGDGRGRRRRARRGRCASTRSMRRSPRSKPVRKHYFSLSSWMRAPARRKPMSLEIAQKRMPRLATASARSALAQ